MVVVPEDELWEEPVAAAYEGAESVRSSPQAQSVALPISARMRRVTCMNIAIVSVSVLCVAIHSPEVRRYAGRQG